MKKNFSALTLFLAALLIPAIPAQSRNTQELWNKFLEKAQTSTAPRTGKLPGRFFGARDAARVAAFEEPWKYRAATYELHYADSAALARTVYGLAVHARDIEPSVSRERFVAGVQGWHYSVPQICAWLNAVFDGAEATPEELALAGFLIKDGVLTLKNGSFVPGPTIKHVLAAAPGKKRSFRNNLLHERIHVFWDENAAFRKTAETRWNRMTEEERTSARQSLKQYADNPPQILEEWAVRQVESGALSLDDLRLWP